MHLAAATGRRSRTAPAAGSSGADEERIVERLPVGASREPQPDRYSVVRMGALTASRALNLKANDPGMDPGLRR
jgi:hypothetical protein